MVGRMVNGQKCQVFNEGSSTPFAFIPGGLKQIFDNESQKYILVALDNLKIEDLRKFSEEQSEMIKSQAQEIKNLGDELVAKDGEILRLNAHIAQLSGAGTPKNLKKQG
jgi:hypothetical protein